VNLKIIPGGPPSPPSVSKASILPVAHLTQMKSQWCWAAAAQMVLDYYGQSKSQCELANILLGKRTCCFWVNRCNVSCTEAQVAQLYSSLGLSSTHHSTPVSFSTIQSEINANRPIEVGFSWSSSRGHLAIVRGWEQNTSGDWVRINDPDLWLHQNNGQGKMLYSKLAKPYGIGKWVATWTDLK